MASPSAWAVKLSRVTARGEPENAVWSEKLVTELDKVLVLAVVWFLLVQVEPFHTL